MSIFIGCGKGDDKKESSEKVLTICSQEDIGDLNPHAYSSQMFAQNFIYENLLSYGEDGQPKPCLAESWDISPDGKEYTFHLRKGVKFSDGSELTADVVKKNYDAFLKARDEHSWLELINQIVKTEAVDKDTFKIYLKDSYYPVLQELMQIRPMTILGDDGFPEDEDTSKGIKKPIGTGPWVLDEYKKGVYSTFVRNENYWGTKPKLSKVVVKVIPDGETAAAALEKGEIDMIYGSEILDIDRFNELKKNDEFVTEISEPVTTRVIGINSNRGATKDLGVRMAIQYGVDRNKIIENVLFNTEKKADTLFSEELPYCKLGLKARDYDEKEAIKYLEDAGWKLSNGKKYREKGGKQLELGLYFIGNNNIQKAIGEAIQGDLKDIGIKVNLVGEEENSFYKRQKDGDFDLIFGESWGAPYDPHSYVASFCEPSHFDYQAQLGLPMKKNIDENIGKMLVSNDENVRKDLYKDILTTIHEQAVYLPVSYRTNRAAYSKDITGLQQYPMIFR